MHESQGSISCFATQPFSNVWYQLWLKESVEESCQRGKIKLCVLCRPAGNFQAIKKKGMSNKLKCKMKVFFSLCFIASSCALCPPPHPLYYQHTLLIQSREPAMEPAKFLAAANHVPFLSFSTTLLPSWLLSLSSIGFLHRALLIDKVCSRISSK